MLSGDLGRLLLILGLVIAGVGALILIGRRFGLGQLPGDISVSSGNFSFYFPIVTCIVISVVLTVLLNLFLRLRG